MKLKNNISINTLLKEYEDNGIFNDAQLCNIKLGLMFGDDVEIYAKPEFTYKQMDVIASGMVHNIDVTKYAPLLSASLPCLVGFFYALLHAH